MKEVSLEQYRNLISSKRKEYFMPPYDLVYKVFVELGLDHKSKQFFIDNASYVVESLRTHCWEMFEPIEKMYTSMMLRELIDADTVESMEPISAIESFCESYPEHIYQLSLSNTQSRRSRAGKEFEAIIELLLIGAGIPTEAQGNVGKKVFADKGLGKLVDVVVPGVREFEIDKSDSILISAKTTLRERWQEVPEEMGRTGAREMFLVTLDNTISKEVLDTLYEANIRLTTTKHIKDTNYANNRRVVTFEDLLSICQITIKNWDSYHYQKEQIDDQIRKVTQFRNKHLDHKFVLDYYDEWIDKLKRYNDSIK